MFKLIYLILLGSLSSVIGQPKSALTIYNGGQSLVKEIRPVSYKRGQATFLLRNVTSTLFPETIIITPKDGSGVQVLETSYVNGSQGQDKMATLEDYINKTISFKSGDKVRTGKLIAYAPDWIKIQSSSDPNIIEFYDGYGELRLPVIQTKRIKTPTIVFVAKANKPIIADTETSYRTAGLTWSASYAINVYPDQTKANVSGFVNIENNSGKDFINTNLSLVTGDIKSIQHYQPPPYSGQQIFYAPAQTSAEAPPPEPSFSPQAIGDYHLYSLNRYVNVTSGSNKQIQLFNKVNNVNMSKQYVANGIDSGANPQSVKFQTQYTIENTKENGLGDPLPAGVVRIFKKDTRGSNQFIGEDQIGHVPQGQNITVRTGTPFDLKADYTVKQKKQLKPKDPKKRNDQNNKNYEAKLQLNVTNSASKEAPIELTLNERQPNLTISYDPDYNSTNKWQRVDAFTYKMKTKVPSNSSILIKWNERVYN